MTIVIKQAHLDSYVWSELKFEGIVFQSLPDISSFNLIHEITMEDKMDSVISQVENYLNDNPGLKLANIPI